MDMDLGSIFIYIITLISIVFLLGFGIAFLVSSAFAKRRLQGRVRSKLLLFTGKFAVSLIVGVLAVFFLFQWDQYEAEKFRRQRVAFGDRMETEYSVQDLRYDSTQSQPFTLSFTVPADDVYWLEIYGYIAKDNEYGSNLAIYGDQVVDVSKYPYPLTQGAHQISFGFREGIQPSTIQALDFEITLAPGEPREELINSQQGIAVANAGEVECRDGIIYYSPKLSYRYCNFLGYAITCADRESLRLNLTH